MRVAIFTNNYLPNPYGVTRSIESFREQLEKNGHTVFIFAPRSKTFIDENPNVFRYPSIDLKYKINYPLPIPFSWKIRKILKTLQIDVVHSQHPSLLGWVAAKLAKKKQVPLVFTWHTLYDRYIHFVPLLPRYISFRWVIKNAVKYANRSDCVITPTESIVDIIRKWGVTNQNIQSIASGVEEEKFSNPNRKSVREKYGIKSQDILLFSVCRLTVEKNTQLLFRCAFKILKNFPQVKFLVVSNGDLRRDLEASVENAGFSNRVFFAGVIERDEIKNFYAAADIFIYSSLSETQGMVVSEALYMGLPVVAVQATGISSLIKNEVNGVLTSENVSSFTQAIIDLINDPEKRGRLGDTARKIAQKELTASVCAEKLENVYEKVVRNKRYFL